MPDANNSSTRAAMAHRNEFQLSSATGKRQLVRLFDYSGRRYPDAKRG